MEAIGKPWLESTWDGTAVNYTLVNQQEQFLIEGLCEHPALSKQGPEICLKQIEDGLKIAAERAQVTLSDIVAVGLDTPGPASAAGMLSAKGSTNFVHPDWADSISAEALAKRLGKPVAVSERWQCGRALGALHNFRSEQPRNLSLGGDRNRPGGGIIIDGNVVRGRMGFGGELGHVLIPYQSIAGTAGLKPECNLRPYRRRGVGLLTYCYRKSLLPFFLPRYPGHELAKLANLDQAAKLVRGLADKGDALSRDISGFRLTG